MESVTVTTPKDAKENMEIRVITGIIKHAGQNTIVVKRRMHDITGVSITNHKGEAVPERGIYLCGKPAIIVYRDGQVISVKMLLLNEK